MKRTISSVASIVVVAAAMPALGEDLQAGADLYNDNCAICHGAKGEGYPKEVVPDGAVRIKKLAGDSAYWDFATFKQTVMTGKDDHGRPMQVMPVFEKTGLYEPPGAQLTDDDLMNIQAYMKTFGPQE